MSNAGCKSSTVKPGLLSNPGGNEATLNNHNYYGANANCEWEATCTGCPECGVKAKFTRMRTERNADWVDVYKATSTGTRLAHESGAWLPSDVWSAAGEKMVVKFTSDGSGEMSGFEMLLTCGVPPPGAEGPTITAVSTNGCEHATLRFQTLDMAYEKLTYIATHGVNAACEWEVACAGCPECGVKAQFQGIVVGPPMATSTPQDNVMPESCVSGWTPSCAHLRW